MNSAPKKQTAIIGFPLSHSLSPLLHNAMYEREGVNAEMKAYANESITDLIKLIRETPIELTAVTIPHKQTVIEFLDEVDPAAIAIGAVNTIINRNGKLIGYNTDVVGIAKALEGVVLKDKNVLIIGAGGAAQAVGYYVEQKEGRMFCLNRNAEHAKSFVQKFGGRAISAEELENQEFDVIINTTPIGMSPHEAESPLTKNVFKPSQTVFDLIYNPLETKFLHEAKAAGAKTISGLTMFIAQGLGQERLWLGRGIEDKGYKELIIV